MAESISVSPHFIAKSKPTRTFSSYSSPEAYILSIVSLPGQYAASTSSPSNKINIFDKSTLHLVQSLPGHEEGTTGLKSVHGIGGNPSISLVSSGKDGNVIVWDDRTNSGSIRATSVVANAGRRHPLLCFDVSQDGMTVTAGTVLQGEDAMIHYWDPRQPSAPLRTHGSTHSDDITTLSFFPLPLGDNKTLLSGSSDGLISVSNADEEDEDEAVLHVANWGCSVSQAGWIRKHDGRPGVWAASDMETFSTWTSELEPLLSVDIRSPSVHSQGRTWVTDYLITCVGDTSSPTLGAFVGSNEGDVALLSHSDLITPNAPWQIHKQWSNGHVGVVRSLLWDEEHSVLVTGGEDGKINVWSGLDRDVDGREEVGGSRKRDTRWEEEVEEEHEEKRARRW